MGLKRNRDDTIESFFIQHTLPRFPAMQDNGQLFDTNVSRKGQHFLCVSMRDTVPVRTSESRQMRVRLQHEAMQRANFYKLLHIYASTVRVAFLPAIQYDMDSAALQPFSDVFDQLSGFPVVEQGSPVRRSRSRSRSGSLSDPSRATLQHFASSPAGMQKLTQTSPPLTTEPRHRAVQGLRSFELASTGDADTQLRFRVFVKAPRCTVDLYDDVTALFSIDHRDYAHLRTRERPRQSGERLKQTALLMIAQSFADSSTLGLNEKTLINTPRFRATVHVVNSLQIDLPVEPPSAFTRASSRDRSISGADAMDAVDALSELGGSDSEQEQVTGRTRSESVKQQLSLYKDHSKWSVTVLYGQTGFFPPLLCFYDLNRSAKQAHRGGGAFCLNTTLTGPTRAGLWLWSEFLQLRPQPTNMARLLNTSIQDILLATIPSSHLPSNLARRRPVAVVSMRRQQSISTRSQSRDETQSGWESCEESGAPVDPIPSALPEITVFHQPDAATKTGHAFHFAVPAFGVDVTLPSPYTYETAASHAMGGQETQSIPDHVLQSFIGTVNLYGAKVLNEALKDHGLVVIQTENVSFPEQSDGVSHSPPSGSQYTPLRVKHVPGRSPAWYELSATPTGPQKRRVGDYLDDSPEAPPPKTGTATKPKRSQPKIRHTYYTENLVMDTGCLKSIESDASSENENEPFRIKSNMNNLDGNAMDVSEEEIETL